MVKNNTNDFSPISSESLVFTNKDITSVTNSFPTTLATLTGTQTLTNKDLSSGTNTFPAFITASSSSTLTNKDLSSGTNTFPAFITASSTDTLTNKDISSATNTFPAMQGGSKNFTYNASGSYATYIYYVQIGKNVDVVIGAYTGTVTAASSIFQCTSTGLPAMRTTNVANTAYFPVTIYDTSLKAGMMSITNGSTITIYGSATGGNYGASGTRGWSGNICFSYVAE